MTISISLRSSQQEWSRVVKALQRKLLHLLQPPEPQLEPCQQCFYPPASEKSSPLSAVFLAVGCKLMTRFFSFLFFPTSSHDARGRQDLQRTCLGHLPRARRSGTEIEKCSGCDRSTKLAVFRSWDRKIKTATLSRLVDQSVLLFLPFLLCSPPSGPSFCFQTLPSLTSQRALAKRLPRPSHTPLTFSLTRTHSETKR